MNTIKPTKEQFQEFVNIRNSGMINMLDEQTIMRITQTGLNRSLCLYIYEHFSELAKEYQIDV